MLAGVTKLPFLDELDDIFQMLIPNAEPISSLDNLLMIDIKKLNMESTASSLDSVNALQVMLNKNVHLIAENTDLSKRERGIKLAVLTHLMQNATEGLSSSTNFAAQVDKMLYIALRELFEKSNVTIIQLCEFTENPLDDKALNKEKIVKTKFSNNDEINKLIYGMLTKMQIPVNEEVISTDVLNKVFPASKLKFEGDNEPNTTIDDFYVTYDESISSQYVNARAELLKKDAEEREAKKIALEKAKKIKEEEERLEKIRLMGLDPEEEEKKRAKTLEVFKKVEEGIHALKKLQRGKKPLNENQGIMKAPKVTETLDLIFNYNFGIDIINESIIENKSGQFDLLAKHLKTCIDLELVQVYIAIANPMGGKVLTTTTAFYSKFVKTLQDKGVTAKFEQIGDLIYREPAPEVKEPLGIFLKLCNG